LPGAKLNAPCATQRVNYRDVIYNLAGKEDRFTSFVKTAIIFFATPYRNGLLLAVAPFRQTSGIYLLDIPMVEISGFSL
jgi:hypothetical protein